MDKPDRRFPGLEPRLVEQSDNGPPERTRRRGAADAEQIAAARDDEVVPVRGDVGVRAPDLVEPAQTGLRVAVVRPAPFVPLEAEVRARQVPLHGIPLPLRHVVDVGEPPAGPEPRSGDLLVLARRPVRGQVRRAYGQDVRARREELRVEHVVVRPHAPGRVRVGGEARDARVARGDHDRGALEPQLHDLGALPLLVRRRQLGLGAAVRDADHVRRLVDAAVQLPRVAPLVLVRVLWVATLRALAIARLTERFERAVAAVDGIPEI